MKNPVKMMVDDLSYGDEASIWVYIGAALFQAVMLACGLLLVGLILAGVYYGLPHSLIPVGLVLAAVLYGAKVWFDNQQPKVRIKK